MKKYIIVIILIFISSSILIKSEDKISYEYDECGNRIKRSIVPLQAPPPPGGRYRDSIKTSEISIYPNPTENILTVKITNLKKDITTKIIISDISGRPVFTMDNLVEINEINFSELTNGIYLMRIFIGSDVSDWKVLKEK
jgi:hypothetical protein